MRTKVSLMLVLCAVVTGFLFAGLAGAAGFGVLLFAPPMIQGQTPSTLDMRWLIFGVFRCLAGYALTWFFGLIVSDPRLHTRLRDIRVVLQRQGHRPTWYIIPQYRSTASPA